MIKKTNFKKITQDKAFWSALLFTILIYAIEEKLLDAPQIKYFRTLLKQSFDSQIIGLLAGFAAFLLLFTFVWFSITASKRFKIIYFVLFSAIVMAQYSYWGLFEQFMSADDLYTAIHSPPSLWRMSAMLFFNYWSLLPIILYLILLVSVHDEQRHSLWKFAGIIVAFVLYSAITLYTPYQETTGVSVLSIFNALTDFTLSAADNTPPVELGFHADSPPANNIVLIIDESVRADHLSVNGYKRPTTPYLEELAGKDYFYNWGTAVSGATCSYHSNLLILTGAPVESDKKSLLTQYPYLTQYARAMGYKVYYFDAQTSHLWNGLRVKDMNYLEQWVTATDLGGEEDYLRRDFRAADKINQIINQSTGNFIVFNKRGVHFVYEYDYPAEEAVWLPISPDYLKYRTRPDLTANAYDNAILFNVNTFFQHLFPDINALPDNTFYIYTSDHSQTLFEHNESWAHCGSTKNEAKVPLLLIGQLKRQPDTTYKASHRNILPTILDLMNVPNEERLRSYAPSLLTATAKDSTTRRFAGKANAIVIFDDE